MNNARRKALNELTNKVQDALDILQEIYDEVDSVCAEESVGF